MGWEDAYERSAARYRDGEARLPEDPDERQRQLTRMGNAAYAAGLCALMREDGARAREWLARAADRYRDSMETAPAGSWGRHIGSMKCRLIAGDWNAAVRDAEWTLNGGAGLSDSPIAKYAAALAFLILEEDDQARILADEIRIRGDFPRPVGDALAMIAAGTDAVGYVEAIESVLESFETRDEYLEDVAVADTVLALQALADRRGLVAELSSPVLPRAGD